MRKSRCFFTNFVTGIGVALCLCVLCAAVLADRNLYAGVEEHESAQTVTTVATTTAEDTKILTGRTIVCFGDSLFGMHRDDTSVPSRIADISGATVYNVGFGGCRMSKHPSSGYDEFGMWALSDALAARDWSAQDAAVMNGEGYFQTQLEQLKDIDFQSVDAVVIHYGTNDFAGNAPLDSDQDPYSVYTLCGALRYSLRALEEQYPHLQVVVSLPLYRFWNVQDGSLVYADEYYNQNGDRLSDVVDHMKTVCDEEGVVALDGYREVGITRETAAQYLSDGVHLTEEGRRLFGDYLAQKLSEVIPL